MCACTPKRDLSKYTVHTLHKECGFCCCALVNYYGHNSTALVGVRCGVGWPERASWFVCDVVWAEPWWVQLASTEEFIDGQFTGNLGEILIRYAYNYLCFAIARLLLGFSGPRACLLVA